METVGQTRCAGIAGTGFWPPELGSRAPTTWEPRGEREAAGPGVCRGLAPLLEKPLALWWPLVASGPCCMCIFSINQPAGGVSLRNTAPNTFNRRNKSLKKTKKHNF